MSLTQSAPEGALLITKAYLYRKSKYIAYMNLEIAPIEQLAIPEYLDGTHGTNRAIGNRPQIAANTDIEALKGWLARFSDTKTTFDNYRKEAERLLLWATGVKNKALSSLTHEDMLEYQIFMGDPKPDNIWIMKRKVGRSHPDWRPFAGPLAPSSQRQSIIILNTMFSWLVNAGYLAGNPLSLARNRSRKAAPRISRYLDEELWLTIKNYIAQLPCTTKRETLQAARTRWLFTLLYLCGLRISEVSNNTMGSFFSRKDKQGNLLWWLEVIGKGSKIRMIPASEELMRELVRYRTVYSLPPFPCQNEMHPLLLTASGRPKPLTRAAIHDIVKGVFQGVADQYRAQGPQYETQAEHIASASAHWLRHTAGSHMANQNVDLRHVRQNLGHESLTTTSLYLHSSDDDRHAETSSLHRINW